jgi:hypothetical protein
VRGRHRSRTAIRSSSTTSSIPPAFLELVTFLEETYAIKVEEDEMVPENLDSLDSLVQFLARKGVA